MDPNTTEIETTTPTTAETNNATPIPTSTSKSTSTSTSTSTTTPTITKTIPSNDAEAQPTITVLPPKGRTNSIFSLNSPSLKLSNLAAKLDRNLGIAKQWTLQKLGATKGTSESPELTAKLQQFQRNRDDIHSLRTDLENIVKAEEGLIQSWEKLASHFLHLSAPIINIGELKENNKNLSVQEELDSTANTSNDVSEVALSPPLALANALQAFTEISRQNLTSLTEFGVEKFDGLIESSIELNDRLIQSLTTMRLDADAKADTLLSKRGRIPLEEEAEYERTAEIAASGYNAQCEVVEKLCAQVHNQKKELINQVMDDYLTMLRDSNEKIAECFVKTEEEANRKDFAIYFIQHGIHGTESDDEDVKKVPRSRIESL